MYLCFYIYNHLGLFSSNTNERMVYISAFLIRLSQKRKCFGLYILTTTQYTSQKTKIGQ